MQTSYPCTVDWEHLGQQMTLHFTRCVEWDRDRDITDDYATGITVTSVDAEVPTALNRFSEEWKLAITLAVDRYLEAVEPESPPEPECPYDTWEEWRGER